MADSRIHRPVALDVGNALGGHPRRSLLALAGFTIAAWGLFAGSSWWETVALAAAAVGLVAVIPYAVAASRDGEPVGATAWNMLTHVMMVAGVFVLLLVPQLEGWVDHHVMGG